MTEVSNFHIAPMDPMLARFLHSIGGFCDARIISIAGPSPCKGTSHEVSDFLSHDTDRWAIHLLQRDWPDPKKFAYTFDHYAEIMNHFTEALGLSRYTLYMQDYGGPVGFRMA